MKEAAGEANMTVITIVLIGIIAAIAIPLISSLMENSTRSSCCQNAGGQIAGTTCNPHAGASAAQAQAVEDNYNQCISDSGLTED